MLGFVHLLKAKCSHDINNSQSAITEQNAPSNMQHCKSGDGIDFFVVSIKVIISSKSVDNHEG